MTASSPARRARTFGEFTLDLDRGALLRGGIDTHLQPRPYAVLCYLVERQGRLVTKKELLDAVWGHRAVTEGAVTHSLIEIRRVLGEKGHAILRTIPRRGFVFEAPVTDPIAPPPEPAAEPAGPPARIPPATLAARPSRARAAVRWGLAPAVALGAFGLWWSSWDHGDTGPAGETPAPTPSPSIAVLPFMDLSPEQDQAWFSDGLAEELLNLLVQVDGLRVTARTSSFSFKDQHVDIATIAEKLNVDHVLEGSVRRWGDRVRVTAQLIETMGSSHLWSATYDREVGDLFAIQGEIAAAVVRALRGALSADGPVRPDLPANVVAYEHYLHARFLFNRRGPGDLERARRSYRQALAADPEYGAAWAGLAGAIHIDILEGRLGVEENLGDFQLAVERALALAPGLADTQHRAAAYYRMAGQPARAREHSTKALAAGQNDPLGLRLAAYPAYRRGELEHAIELHRRAIALDPLAGIFRNDLAFVLSAAGRHGEAEAELRHMMELSAETSLRGEAFLADTLIRQERPREALEVLASYPDGEERDLRLVLANRALAKEADAVAALDRLKARPGYMAAVRVAEALAQHGEIDESFRWLDIARLRINAEMHPAIHRNGLLRVTFSLWLAPLHGDPRWDAWAAIE